LINAHINRVIHLKGNPREVGYSAGCLLGNTLEQVVDHYLAHQPVPKDFEKLHTGALPWLRGLPERYQQEFEGLAEGAKIPLQRLAEFNFIEECDILQCSGIIYPYGNHVWVARNNDTYVPELWGYATIREVEGRIPTISFGMQGDVFAPTGINLEKLWLHYNFLSAWDQPSAGKPHFPGYVFLTEALELCHNIDDVQKLLSGIDRDGGMLLFAVDGKTNDFAIFECLCSKVYRREPSQSWMVGTNHYCACQDLTLCDADKEPLRTLSRFSRLEILMESLSTSQRSSTLPSDLIRILADDNIELRAGRLVTAYSNVTCPDTGEIWYTFGGYPSASQGNWQRLEWPWKD
jgi:hypothetical protein